MRFVFWLGLAFVIAGLVVVITGNTGAGISVPAIIGGGVLFVLGGTLALTARGITKAHERAAAAVRDLETRGVRRTGIVRDVVPFASPMGGAVLQAEGAQLVVQIELERPEGGTQRVTCHLVENTEDARARIGKPITILEHPDDRELRTIEGYLPNGRRRA